MALFKRMLWCISNYKTIIQSNNENAIWSKPELLMHVQNCQGHSKKFQQI